MLQSPSNGRCRSKHTLNTGNQLKADVLRFNAQRPALPKGGPRTTCVNASRRQLGCQLLCDCTDPLGGQAIFARPQAPHHICKKPGRDVEVIVEEYATQEGPEEAVNHGLGEPLCLDRDADVSQDSLQKALRTQKSVQHSRIRPRVKLQ